MQADVRGFFDPATYTISYVVADPATRQCAIVDSVLDYDPKSGRTSTAGADALIAHVRANGLTVTWILETHAHADHLSAAPYLKRTLGGRTAIGEHITAVQGIMKSVFNLEASFATDGSQFDHLFKDGETFTLGNLSGHVLHTPGHTPACVTFVIGDAAFIGDTLFMPDYGTARCDFPGGDAATLYHSIQRILALPAATRLFMCHDYLPKGGRTDYAWETTVGDERDHNIHIGKGTSEDDYVRMRESRDATLPAPVLLMPSIQVNMRAGQLPPADANGVHYIRVPITLAG